MSVARWARGVIAAWLAVCAGLLVIASTAMASTNFTWSGNAPSPNWSLAANWAGGSAPSGSVGTLSFLNTGCGSGTCDSTNDLSGLAVSGLSIDDTSPYAISGNAIGLGAGGITATSNAGNGVPVLSLPIALSAPQTWAVAAASGRGWLSFTGQVTGSAADAVGVDLSAGGTVYLTGNDVEVGPVAITGTNPASSGNQASQNGGVVVGQTSAATEVNGTDGQPVSLTDAQLSANAAPASVGALTSTGGHIVVGVGNSGYSGSDGTLAIDGGLTMDSASALQLFLDNPGMTPGLDYTNVTATGPVNLGGATGDLDIGETSGGACPTLNPGDVDTLVSSTGPVTGTFAGIPDGKLVQLYGICSGHPQYVRVNYTAHAVTATILGHSLPVNTSPPTIAGGTVQGQTLTASPGSWTNSPTSYSYQWFDCDSQGSCTGNGATSSTYTLTAADVGYTLFVQVTASNGNGTSASFAQSARTAVVTAASGQSPPVTNPSTPKPPINLSSPTISGKTVLGQTLNEGHGTWTGNPTSYSYIWKRCNRAGTVCSTISRARSYKIQTADLGSTILVLEAASNAGGSGAPASSFQTATVTKPSAPKPPTNARPPVISGRAVIGQTLTESHGRWRNGHQRYSYKWYACHRGGADCSLIRKATGRRLKLTAAVLGDEIRVREIAYNAAGSSAPARSAPTKPVHR